MSRKLLSLCATLLLLFGAPTRLTAQSAGADAFVPPPGETAPFALDPEPALPDVAVPPSGVGVVLSGGGAKGLYHIGVLEALEAYNIPIDYVAGTSMGSIIAAMYAAGYSPAEMRRIVLTGAVREWVSGRIDPNRYLPYYRQYGQLPAFLTVRLDLRKGERLFAPTNLLSSTQIDMAFTELFKPATVAAEGDFDRLMVPFRCVAADMNNRRPVVFRRGELAEAVRSSMSIPLVFKAMTIDSMLLYDGGIYDNFPWKPLDEAFRPGLIIGSICTSGNTPPSEQNDLLDQFFLLAMQDTDYKLPEGSITIARAVDTGMLDFDRAEETMDAGYLDALAQIPEILRRVDRRTSPAEIEARREAFRRRCPPLLFDNYLIEGVSPAQEAYIRDFMQIDRPTGGPRTMPFDTLRNRLYEVLADGDFTMDFPTVAYQPERDCYAFAGHFQTKPNFGLAVGGNLSSTSISMVHIGMTYRSIGRVAQSWGAKLFLGPAYSWGVLGGRTDFYAGKPIFLDYSFHFQTRNLEHGKFGNLSGADNLLHVRQNGIHGSVGIGRPLTFRSILAVRTNFGHLNYRYAADDPTGDATDHTRFAFFGVQTLIERNTLDRMVHAQRGSKLHLSGIYITGTDKLEPFDAEGFRSRHHRDWFGARFTWDKFFDVPRCDWFSLGLNVDAVFTNHPSFSRNGATLLTMPAYTPTQHAEMIYAPAFRGKRFVAGGVMPTFNIVNNGNGFIRAGFYAMYREQRADDPLFAGYSGESQRLHYIADLSAVYHTPIGPVSLTLTKYDLNNWKNMYLVFSFGYALFAPKGIFY